MKRFIYLISPNKIDKNFYTNLKKVLSSKKVKYFQLRVKGKTNSYLITNSKKIKTITDKFKVKLIINDSPKVAKTVKAAGCHIGQSDASFITAKKEASD